MRRFILILLFQWPVLFVAGQDDFCNIAVDQRSLFEAVLTGQPCQMKTTIGNQFFGNDFFYGKVILTSGDTVRCSQIGYNGYQDELIWRLSDGTNIKVDREQVASFILYGKNNEPAVAFTHLLGKTADEGPVDLFAKMLLDNTLSLFVSDRVHIIDVTQKRSFESDSYVERIKPGAPVYYISMPDHRFQVIKHINKKVFYKAFPDQKEIFKTLFAEHNQALRNEADLISVLRLMIEMKVIK